jgi:hypothetical protein
MKSACTLFLSFFIVSCLHAMEKQSDAILPVGCQIANFRAGENIDFDALGKELATHSTLEKLLFEKVEFTSDISQFAEGLRNNTSVRRLIFTDCVMSIRSLWKIVSAVQHNQHIKALDLWEIVDPDRKPFNDLMAELISRLISGTKSLKALYVYRAMITDEGGKKIASNLKMNNTLTNVQIGFTKMGDEGVSAMLDALKTNKTLETLDLNPVAVSEKIIRRKDEKFRGRVRIKFNDELGSGTLNLPDIIVSGL